MADNKAGRVLIVEARFYEKLADEMKAGAIAVLEEAQLAYDVVGVPGGLEIPAAVAFAVPSGKYDGYIALGCVIRGETSHYDNVANEAIRGLQELALMHNLAIGTGILTVENEAQAWARADRKKRNRGGVAALACLHMIGLKAKFPSPVK